ncbi:sugar kinase [Lacisediminimonas profundi]|uniref:sugar kinase n=1 Tax=Lacisediminimonas profundi TaxID=2603856 RepID=UPI00124BBF79|nr:sugar kinase [Lacisediminimonas profundi]
MNFEQIHVVCVGNSTLDRVWLVDQLPVGGGKFRAHDYLELGGGMAANAAVAVARLGGAASYWGRNGNDTAGHTMREELSGYKVDVAQFRLVDGARSSVSAILVSNDGERSIVNFRGSDIPADASWLPVAEIAKVQAVHGDVRWVAGALAAYTAARELGVPTVLDGEIAEPEDYQVLLPLVDHAIFSEPGLRSFLGDAVNVGDELSPVLGLQRARDLGCRVAAVTRGAKGTVWLDDAGVHFQPAFPVEVVDTTGAGDVFHGAYACAIAAGCGVAQAMRMASAVAAMKCTRKGGRAGIPTLAEVESFLARLEP